MEIHHFLRPSGYVHLMPGELIYRGPLTGVEPVVRSDQITGAVDNQREIYR